MKTLPKNLLFEARKDAEALVKNLKGAKVLPSPYNNKTYYKDLTKYEYFDALVLLRHYIKSASDVYFGQVVKARNVDLFMITPSVSSPMGPGSDSEVVPIKFGKYDSFLVDSSQFGFEPLIFQGIKKVYCYLPSMRGEDPDARHLNQFFHCEAEIVGTLDDLTPIMEGYIRALASILIALDPLIKIMSANYPMTKKALEKIVEAESFKSISFDAGYDLLQQTKATKKYTKKGEFGREINSDGERFITQSIGSVLPIWMKGFDRDTVAFYQKPDPKNTSKVINADLLFPPLTDDGFSGEIIGSGQRQDNPQEMVESLRRQGINPAPYKWYIDLRRQPGYRTTSGFGLGIERFIAWSLGYKSIRDVILYPRLKNIQTIP